ncbi:unnamed protein product [Rhizoctonia solani]|uniref:F-box domain-containing protein n=1 Tax=Rhizoctonia solani TaxID=456999 RepID=A0A8H2X1H5_9AGAM|nr:unnamed protein product [Rhizoctonia solani]
MLGMGDVFQGTKSQPTTEKSPDLSYEIIGLIADFLFELKLSSHSGNTESDTICCVKPKWRHVVGFMNASSQLHRIGLERWVAVLTIRTSQDLEVATSFSPYIRELIFDIAPFLPLDNSVWSRFPKLRAISVDCHEDVQPVSGTHRFAYRDVVATLPQTLRYLETRHAHGPDVNVIACAKRDCPNLESLRLGRCTAFNRIPACQFWRSFPFEHDSYFSCEGSDSYAHSLADELAPLRSLRLLRLGIYLMPSTAVLAHRCFHIHEQPAPPQINWQAALTPMLPDTVDPQPQPQSPQASDLIALLHQAPEEKDLTSANRILKEVIPNLDRVEWMDWFTSKHLGVCSV